MATPESIIILSKIVKSNMTIAMYVHTCIRSDQKVEFHVVRELNLASFLIALFFRKVCSIRSDE